MADTGQIFEEHETFHALENTSTLEETIAKRTKAIDLATSAIEAIAQGFADLDRAESLAFSASEGSSFYLKNEKLYSALRDLNATKIDSKKCVQAWTENCDGGMWDALFKSGKVYDLMDATALKEIEDSMRETVPAFELENVLSTISSLQENSDDIWKRGIAASFSQLDDRFKSHDAFKIQSRMIIERCFCQYGYWSEYSKARRKIQDVERVLAKLDGKQPNPHGLIEAVNESRKNNEKTGYVETEYLRIRTFKNGNAHLWFTRPDLVKKVNLLLADYYGEVLPDGAEKDTPEDLFKSKTGLPSKDLQYYPTPKAVCDKLMNMLDVCSASPRILEPSAGDGAIVRALIEKDICGGAHIDAIEIHEGRAQACAQIWNDKLTVTCENFLNRTALPVYDYAVMNPPFSGDHYMQHVQHAFEMLVAGGELLAVLPITAKVGESKRQIAFREWAGKHSRYGNNNEPYFVDLPQSSFKESGTNINTVILSMQKAR